jgi:hypothetical protein
MSDDLGVQFIDPDDGGDTSSETLSSVAAGFSGTGVELGTDGRQDEQMGDTTNARVALPDMDVDDLMDQLGDTPINTKTPGGSE